MTLDVVWTFVRENHRLTLYRQRTETGVWLIEDRPGLHAQAYFFSDVPSLIRLETDHISALRQEGWSLIDFSPERRSGGDRRQRRREGPDRRRWVWQPL